jgi:hypothetical protein
MESTNTIEQWIFKAISRAGALTDLDLSVMFGRRALSVLCSLETSGLVRREGGKWLAAQKLRELQEIPVAPKISSAPDEEDQE